MLRYILKRNLILCDSLKLKSSSVQLIGRSCATSPSQKMVDILKSKFPLAKDVQVVDVSGGCGAMYEVLVESEEFKGLSIVKQHRMINEILKDQIKEMHGLRIHTVVPKDDKT